MALKKFKPPRSLNNSDSHIFEEIVNLHEYHMFLCASTISVNDLLCRRYQNENTKRSYCPAQSCAFWGYDYYNRLTEDRETHAGSLSDRMATMSG